MSLDVTIVDACQRVGRGGSPTAVLDELPLSDADRCAIPASAGTSHVAFLSSLGDGSTALRFFTATGELPACGHGTVAVLAVLARRAGRGHFRTVLRAGGRTFSGSAAAHADGWRAEFDPGPVHLRKATRAESAMTLTALGLRAAECVVGSVGRERMLVEVPDRSMLPKLTPDIDGLRRACDQFGLLGCYVYTMPSRGGPAAARMFAPSIGVNEDIANANSTACLAAHLAGRGVPAIDVDMGDALGVPATITASVRVRPTGPQVVRVGGAAALAGLIHV